MSGCQMVLFFSSKIFVSRVKLDVTHSSRLAVCQIILLTENEHKTDYKILFLLICRSVSISRRKELNLYIYFNFEKSAEK